MEGEIDGIEEGECGSYSGQCQLMVDLKGENMGTHPTNDRPWSLE